MSMLDWRYYPKIARIARMAGADVGRGSETLMTYSRGDLFRAARHLSGSKEGRPARALVVTGFYIPKAAQPAAETDGPLGALEVCMALRAIGGDAWLVSDECCAPVIRPSALGFLPDDHVLIAPNANPKGGFDAWLNGVIDLAKTEHIDTLVYIERVGPARDGSPHNMRGIDITEWTAPLSQLTLLGLHTIGVGDGGNEIGMGRVEDYAIEGVVDHGENIACTVPTDRLVVAGTSNWGAHALVCAMRALGSAGGNGRGACGVPRPGRIRAPLCGRVPRRAQGGRDVPDRRIRRPRRRAYDERGDRRRPRTRPLL